MRGPLPIAPQIVSYRGSRTRLVFFGSGLLFLNWPQMKQMRSSSSPSAGRVYSVPPSWTTFSR